MKIICFGSLNIDNVYFLEDFVRPGETILSKTYMKFCGGKGLNQSIALAKAGLDVYHAGMIGKDGIMLKNKLEECGVSTSYIDIIKENSGHAIIQVNSKSENSIILYSGANHQITDDYIEKVFKIAEHGDYLVLQNEINNISKIITHASELGLKIFFNPAPMHKNVFGYPLYKVDCFIINEIEGKELTGKSEPDDILSSMILKYPDAFIVLTLGSKGVIYKDKSKQIKVPAIKVKPVDTTAAGDTFIGFFIAEISRGTDIETCLKTACKAASICVTKAGAADSIPYMRELESVQYSKK